MVQTFAQIIMALLQIVFVLLVGCSFVANSLKQESHGGCNLDLIVPVSNFNSDRIQGAWYARKIYIRQAPEDDLKDAYTATSCFFEDIRKSNKALESISIPFYVHHEISINWAHFRNWNESLKTGNNTDDHDQYSVEEGLALVITPKGKSEGIWKIVQATHLHHHLEEDVTQIYVDTDYDNWALQYTCSSMLNDTYFTEEMMFLTRHRNSTLDTNFMGDLEKGLVEKYKFPADKSFIINQTNCYT